jgi:hypothetical protein
MLEGPTPEKWAELREDRPVSEDELAFMPVRLDGGDTEVLMAMDYAGQLRLRIPVQRAPQDDRPPDLNGLRVRHLILSDGQFVELAASPAHERVFTPVCCEVAKAVLVEQREPWRAVNTIVRMWQSAWKLVRGEMERSVQVGLIGELFVLKQLMIPSLGPGAVAQWSGPQSERHDFVGARLRVEVKATRRSRHEHEISRLDQLWTPAGTQLLLVSVQLEETVGGTVTLATLRDEVMEVIGQDAAALDEFMAKMARMGWSDEMRRSGELLRCELRDVAVFLVDDGFPRLPESFAPPRGVVAVKYTIDLANLPTMDASDAAALVVRANQYSL